MRATGGSGLAGGVGLGVALCGVCFLRLYPSVRYAPSTAVRACWKHRVDRRLVWVPIDLHSLTLRRAQPVTLGSPTGMHLGGRPAPLRGRLVRLARAAFAFLREERASSIFVNLRHLRPPPSCCGKFPPPAVCALAFVVLHRRRTLSKAVRKRHLHGHCAPLPCAAAGAQRPPSSPGPVPVDTGNGGVGGSAMWGRCQRCCCLRGLAVGFGGGACSRTPKPVTLQQVRRWPATVRLDQLERAERSLCRRPPLRGSRNQQSQSWPTGLACITNGIWRRGGAAPTSPRGRSEPQPHARR